MGIVNLTADSFSGDGVAGGIERAVEQGLRMVEAGADLLDLGAESSRPGALPVDASVELSRLLPVMDRLRSCGVPLSIDTAKVEVMREVIQAGADMINDIGGLSMPGALEAVAAAKVGICMMHMQGNPETMQRQPAYRDVLSEVLEFIKQQTIRASTAGIAHARICVDPGFGFGKTPQHNWLLLKHLRRLCELGYPVLVGLSRKSMLGAATGRVVAERLPSTIAANLFALTAGARIFRVHDVAPMVDAVKIYCAVEGASS